MKFLKLVLVSICVLVFVGLFQFVNAEEKAKSIDELAARYDVSSCKGCHSDISCEWEKSAHAKSMFGLGGRTAATIMTTIERGLKTWPYSGVKGPEDVKLKHLVLCTKCHLPQLDEATDEVAQEIVTAIYTLREPGSVEKLEKLNINCLVCHQKKAITHKWLDGPVEKNAVYGSKDGAHPYGKYPIMKKGPIMHESILCGQCHGLGPNLEFEEPSQCATAYGSYLFAYIPEGGHETCQNCHMEKLKKGHAISSYRDMDMARAALDFNVVDVYSYHWRKNKEEGVIPLAVARVEMTNKTGHGVPDG
jgi:hypothetical protein